MSGKKKRNKSFSSYSLSQCTVKLSKRLVGLIIFLRLKMRVLLEIGCFSLMNLKDFEGLIRIRVLLEGEPYLKFYGKHIQLRTYAHIRLLNKHFGSKVTLKELNLKYTLGFQETGSILFKGMYCPLKMASFS